MRHMFVIFLLPAVKNVGKKKRWSGTAGVQKRLRKSQKRQGAMQFVFCLFFYFNEKKNSNDVSKIFVGLFLFTSYPLCSSQQQTQRSLARFIILLCTLIHLPSTTPSSSSSSFSSLNPTCSTTFSPSNDGPLRYLLPASSTPPFYWNLICPISDFDPKSLFDVFSRLFSSLLQLGHSLFSFWELLSGLLD